MNITSLINDFANKRILVLGDVMVDAYRIGGVSRVSPEAPVPIVDLKKKEERLGGAANVALNLQALGAEPILCSVIGNDDGAVTFQRLLDEKELTRQGIICDEDRKTSVKIRVIGNNQQLLRIDDELVKPLSDAQEKDLINKVRGIINAGIDAIILEDYNKGVLTPTVIREVISMANEKDIIVTVDPKKDNFFEYRNVTLFKPNLKELKEGLGVDFDISSDKASFEKAIDLLEERLNNKISFVTLSEHGVFIREGADQSYIPAHVRNIADVSGAGDTVIAVATLCLSSGMTPEQVARIANLSGGLVCEMSGVVPLDRGTLMDELNKLKI